MNIFLDEIIIIAAELKINFNLIFTHILNKVNYTK
jgi:hypothetical protein